MTDPTAHRRPDVGALTPDDIDLLALMATGVTRAAVARTLGCSPRTVLRRLDEVTERSGAVNLTQLIVAAVRGGVL